MIRMGEPILVGVLTVSDRSARGERVDESGPVLRSIVEDQLNAQVARWAVVPDEAAQITAMLCAWADEDHLDLILTTGGTGVAPRDVTPEATLAVIERRALGIEEAMRAASLQVTPYAMLSRAVAGIRGRTLIINLPGNPRAVRDQMAVILPVLPHAIALLRGVADDASHG
jgi:molybdenum cofactor synthesis domain-containing protein